MYEEVQTLIGVSGDNPVQKQPKFAIDSTEIGMRAPSRHSDYNIMMYNADRGLGYL
jgi:hypothetical protein